MPHKNILVLLNGTVCEMQAKITRTKNVSFIPPDSDQKLTIEFTDRVPFSDWETSRQTGDRGKSLKGKVDNAASGSYPYTADCDPGSTAPAVLANPELIVDGGDFPPPPSGTKKITS